MTRRRTAAVFFVAMLLVAVARPLSADIRILTHDAADIAPHQVKTVIDIGVVSLNLLVTWTDTIAR